MRILVVWFLVMDDKLNASSLMRDLESVADQGHRVTCILPAIRQPASNGKSNLRVHIIRLRYFLPLLSFLSFSLAAVAPILKYVRDSDAVVVGADEVLLVLPWLHRRTRRWKLAVRVLSPLVEIRSSRRYYHLVLRHLSLLLSRFSDAVFAISPMDARQMRTKYGFSPSKVHVWPSSVDPNVFDPAKYRVDRDRVRRELGLERKFALIHHGVLSPERGLYELLDAIRIVHEKDTNVALLFLGKGRAERHLMARVESYGLLGTVVFHGPVAYHKVPQFIAAADAGVVPLPDTPQWRYQTPTKLLEYLAMGKPVVITDLAAHRWIAGDYPAAFFCGQGRPVEIAAAILKCSRSKVSMDPAKLGEMATRFSPRAVGEALVQVLAKPL